MCYTVSYLLDKRLKLAIRNKENPAIIDRIKEEYEKFSLTEQATFYESGFNPKARLPIIIDATKPKIEMAEWGLIPWFIDDEDKKKTFRMKTLNARSETLFEKASFKKSVRTKTLCDYR